MPHLTTLYVGTAIENMSSDFNPDFVFQLLKKLIEFRSELGGLVGADGTRISELSSPPSSWGEWFQKDNYVIRFSPPPDSVEEKQDFNSVGFSRGVSGSSSSRLNVSLNQNLPPLEYEEKIMEYFAFMISLWDAEEGFVSNWQSMDDTPWLHWLKHDQEPTGYVRYPMPDGWSTKTELLDGMLYEWPENRP